MRSIRRHHKVRLRRKAKKIAKLFSLSTSKEDVEKFADNHAKHNADNLASCSCSMCGNPRRHAKGKDKLTIQEKRNANS